jgi:hypothetical protein
MLSLYQGVDSFDVFGLCSGCRVGYFCVFGIR